MLNLDEIIDKGDKRNYSDRKYWKFLFKEELKKWIGADKSFFYSKEQKEGVKEWIKEFIGVKK